MGCTISLRRDTSLPGKLFQDPLSKVQRYKRKEEGREQKEDTKTYKRKIEEASMDEKKQADITKSKGVEGKTYWWC